jgi:beta-lactam-binding protein with PASTA domain
MLAAMPGESRPGPQRTVVLEEEKPFAALTVSITPTELSVAPGQEASCEVVVRNTGTVVDQATLQVEGEAARWAVVEPSTLNIYPGESGTSTLRFFPPRSPSTPSGPARFALRALSHEDPAVTATAWGVLNVAPYYDVSAELIPFTSQGRRRAEHRFTVNNQGNTRMRSAVNSSDPDNQLRFNVTPSTLAADPGTDAAATVQVRPRKPLWLGSPLIRPFEVTGTSEGAAPALRSQGQFQQIAWIPRWVTRVAMLIIPLLIALFVYLFLTANVPAVAGQPSDQATALLTKDGFKPLAAVSQPNDTVHIGDVVSTSPSGGRHRKHSPVGVVLSSGIPLPNLAGQDEAAGRAALEGKGLIVDEQQVTNAAPMGKVVGTAPPNGSVSKGDHVGLLLSTGIPSLAASPNSLTMPGQAVNSTTAPLAVSIANGGTGPLTVSSVALGGPNAGEFAIANNGCMGASVAPGSSCALQITFTPTAAGARNAVLTFASNAPQSPPVTLSGTGLVSDIGVGATAINFGDQKVGTQSPAQTIMVSNKGSAPMKMGAATVIGPNAKEFSLTDGCKDNTVAPGAGCSIGVVFAPAGGGARSAKLVAANDSGLSQNVTLSGNGTAPMVVTLPDPVTGLTFHDANKPQVVKIINQGTAPLVLGQVTVVGVNQALGRNFQAVPDCGGQLAPNGGSCQVTVTFVPSGLTDSLHCAQAALVISDELGEQKVPMVWTTLDPALCGLTSILSSLGNSP